MKNYRKVEDEMNFEQIQNWSQVIKIVLGVIGFYFVYRIMRGLDKLVILIKELKEVFSDCRRKK